MIKARANRWQVIVVALGLVFTACTSTSDVSDVGSEASSKTDPGATSTNPPGSVPADTTPAEPVGGSTPIAAPDASGLPSIDDPDPEILIGTLDNGLQYLIRNNNNPGGRVDMRLAINAGSALEDDSQTGGAHFLEHMLFNGTEMFPWNELVDVLCSFGSGL